jgi:hypothetical protein
MLTRMRHQALKWSAWHEVLSEDDDNECYKVYIYYWGDPEALQL